MNTIKRTLLKFARYLCPVAYLLVIVITAVLLFITIMMIVIYSAMTGYAKRLRNFGLNDKTRQRRGYTVAKFILVNLNIRILA